LTGEPYLVTTKAHMSAVMELHALCFNSDEQTKITYALLDKSHFSLLVGDEKPEGYIICHVQDKEAHGLWLGVRPNNRGGGVGRKLVLAGLNESRDRGAETFDGQISGDNDTSIKTLTLLKNLGLTLVKSFTDTYINDAGESVEFTNNHVRMSLT